MNNKGQVLVVFILVIPLLLLLGAYIVDTSYISYHTNKLNGINLLVINDEDIEIEVLEITSTNIKITLKKEIKSLFGNIIGKKSYTLTSSKTKNY